MENIIVIASGNAGKIKEAQEILTEYKVISMKDENIDIDIIEDQETFAKNAEKKAFEIAKILNSKILTSKICLADDSGIEIEALDGFPGVYTKRWLPGTDRERNLKIIEKLNGLPKDKRKIKFTTSIAISNGIKTISETEYIEGYVAENVRGENGFGFDEIFELEDGRTLAELSSDEKNKISSRKKALEKIKTRINETR